MIKAQYVSIENGIMKSIGVHSDGLIHGQEMDIKSLATYALLKIEHEIHKIVTKRDDYEDFMELFCREVLNTLSAQDVINAIKPISEESKP